MDPVVEVEQPGRQTLYVVVREPLLVGRECEGLQVDDEQVSRRHLQLTPRAGALIVTDLDSTNGTQLDGRRIAAPTPMEPGRAITLGETTLRLATMPEHSAADGSPLGRMTVVRGMHGNAADVESRTSIEQVVDLAAADGVGRVGVLRTMTIVFTDIEASTERVAELGDRAWYQLLEHHNATVRTALAAQEGREVKSQGDGFMLAFTSVRRALAFAIDVQRRFETPRSEEPRVRIRVGLDTGDVIVDRSGDLFGRHVIVAARIADLATSGQILASGAVRQLASGDDEADFAVGVSVMLKGFDEHVTVHDVLWRGDGVGPPEQSTTVD